MQETLQNEIRERAYHLWLAIGCAGEAEQHWLAAERETLAAAATAIGSPAEPGAKRRGVKAKAQIKKAVKAA